MNRAPFLQATQLCVGYNGSLILENICFQVEPGQRWAVLGKNGTGKSTLVKTIAALLEPRSGRVNLLGTGTGEFSARDRARHIAYVPQKPEAAIPYSVYDFVMLGRYAHLGLFGLPQQSDRAAVSRAMMFCDVAQLGERMLSTLSGGEVQRVLLAGALAQQTPLLLLDEPTTHLDPAHERLFFKALEDASSDTELTVVMVTHDINSALAFCTHVLALREGRVHFSGTAETFRQRCPALLSELFDIPFTRYCPQQGSGDIYGAWGQ